MTYIPPEVVQEASSGKTSAVTKRKSVSHKCVQLSYRTGN